jgi:hypothetical protein
VLTLGQEYVPQTFQLSLFAVGTDADYGEATVLRITALLLARDPSRRQPELVF